MDTLRAIRREGSFMDRQQVLEQLDFGADLSELIAIGLCSILVVCLSRAGKGGINPLCGARDLFLELPQQQFTEAGSLAARHPRSRPSDETRQSIEIACKALGFRIERHSRFEYLSF